MRNVQEGGGLGVGKDSIISRHPQKIGGSLDRQMPKTFLLFRDPINILFLYFIRGVWDYNPLQTHENPSQNVGFQKFRDSTLVNINHFP